MIIPLLLGLAVFLFGMKVMELALHKGAGSKMEHILAITTKTPLRGLLIGTMVTAILQSSSAVTVMIIGLVNAQLLSYGRTIGVILGTNIGTCLTTELIGLNIGEIALPLFITSSCLWMISFLPIKTPLQHRHYVSLQLFHLVRYGSLATGGFACILLGMEIMKIAVPAMQSAGLFTWFMEHAQQSLVWGVVAGAALTALIQSGTAAIAITMSLASMQAISIEIGIAIVLGVNIGTCITSLIASIGGSRGGYFVAWTHVLLNIVGAVIFFPLIPLLWYMAAWFSNDSLAQIAHAQTIYNVLCSFIALPLCYLSIWNKRNKHT
ncbi:Na/Pi cotransporter family protein [Longirhabdus pacifica]|uniref:Na/Pi cotransporter family protein n=1 Tax=Longirhabdus pacifica TaxID=2305227 RepID=UPI0027B98D1F|nr:Na/Pi symporter [Longirhabdus pacifica]